MNPQKELLWGRWVYYCRVLRIESSGVRGWGFRVYVVHGGVGFLDLQNKGCLLHGIVLQKLKVRSPKVVEAWMVSLFSGFRTHAFPQQVATF